MLAGPSTHSSPWLGRTAAALAQTVVTSGLPISAAVLLCSASVLLHCKLAQQSTTGTSIRKGNMPPPREEAVHSRSGAVVGRASVQWLRHGGRRKGGTDTAAQQGIVAPAVSACRERYLWLGEGPNLPPKGRCRVLTQPSQGKLRGMHTQTPSFQQCFLEALYNSSSSHAGHQKTDRAETSTVHPK